MADTLTYENLVEALKKLHSSGRNPLDGPVGLCGCHVTDGILHLCDREKASLKEIHENFTSMIKPMEKGEIREICGLKVFSTKW